MLSNLHCNSVLKIKKTKTNKQTDNSRVKKNNNEQFIIFLLPCLQFQSKYLSILNPELIILWKCKSVKGSVISVNW